LVSKEKEFEQFKRDVVHDLRMLIKKLERNEEKVEFLMMVFGKNICDENLERGMY